MDTESFLKMCFLKEQASTYFQTWLIFNGAGLERSHTQLQEYSTNSAATQTLVWMSQARPASRLRKRSEWDAEVCSWTNSPQVYVAWTHTFYRDLFSLEIMQVTKQNFLPVTTVADET